MSEVNFYLKKPGKKVEKKTGTKAEKKTAKKADIKIEKSLIFLQYKYNGKRLVYSFGQSVSTDNWDKAKQRVKSNKETTSDNKHYLNELLDKLEKLCISSYNSEIKNGIPEPAVLKQYLVDFVNQNSGKGNDEQPTLFKLLDRFVNGEIKNKGEDKSSATLKTYRTLKGHLQEFAAIKKYEVNFETIKLEFYYSYVDFLKNRHLYQAQIKKLRPDWGKKDVTGLDINSIGKDIQILKVVMAEAVDMEYTNNLQFKHKKFAVVRKDTDAVFLDSKEINKLYRFDLSHNKKLENVRDLFVFGALTGLRFSDYSRVKLENIVDIEGDLFIKMITKKTGELVIIPCDPMILEIFDKYSHSPNRLPKSISIQKFNDYIKDICSLVGLTEQGRLSTSMEKSLADCVSSHTCRRSFATNYYLEGFPITDLMKITGHQSEKSFRKYIKISKRDAAKNLSNHIKKNWGAKMLRVAS